MVSYLNKMLCSEQAHGCLHLRKDCTVVFNLRDTAFLNQHCHMFHDSKLSSSDMFIPKPRSWHDTDYTLPDRQPN
jgi:hypothetical protein